eukprot:5019074-Pleurochrysis_carterae.AAC.1
MGSGSNSMRNRDSAGARSISIQAGVCARFRCRHFLRHGALSVWACACRFASLSAGASRRGQRQPRGCSVPRAQGPEGADAPADP